MGQKQAIVLVDSEQGWLAGSSHRKSGARAEPVKVPSAGTVAALHSKGPAYL